MDLTCKFSPQYSLCRQCEWRTFRLRGFWGCKAMECLLLFCPLRHAWTAQAVAPEIRTMVYAVLDTGRLCMCFGGNFCLHAAIPVNETLKDLHRMRKGEAGTRRNAKLHSQQQSPYQTSSLPL